MSEYPPPADAAQAPTPMNPSDERLWATLIHIGGILFTFLPALIGYIVLKDRGPFVRAHAMTALNFQITLLIAYLVGYVLILAFIGFLIVPAVWVLSVVLSIMAALAANAGRYYAYPLTVKFVS